MEYSNIHSQLFISIRKSCVISLRMDEQILIDSKHGKLHASPQNIPNICSVFLSYVVLVVFSYLSL
jgi:hypothetical protein